MKKLTEVTIPLVWFEELVRLAREVDKQKPGKYAKYCPFLHQKLMMLLGYIDSAEFVVKLKNNEK